MNILKGCIFLLSSICALDLQGKLPAVLKEDITSDPMRVELRHIENKGVGYKTGYTTLEAFLAPSSSGWNVTPFLDVRAHVFDNGKFAANGGVGFRLLNQCRVYGINAYYDYRHTHKKNYNQISFGLETMGVRWDFRLNGYIPLGHRKSSPYDIKKSISAPSFDYFFDHQAYIKQTTTTKNKVEFSMAGVDLEAAYHILNHNHFDFYVAAGPYYYNYKHERAIGGRVRLFAKIRKYLSLEMIESYDSRFHNNIQGSIALNIPFGQTSKLSKNKKFKKCDDGYFIAKRLFQDVERQEIIVLDELNEKRNTSATSVAINPLTNKPYNFVFVSNTSSSLGSYESPYPTLALAEQNSSARDIIYVFSGDGTTKGMDSGITLQKEQKFFGSGVAQMIETTNGNVTIPAQTSSIPQITNLTGDIITLNEDNQISGFDLTNGNGHGIYGVDPKNVEIASCVFESIELDQIHIENTISSGDLSFNDLVLKNGKQAGIFINSAPSSLENVVVNNCLIENTALKPLDFTFNNKANITLTNNLIENNPNSSLISFNDSAILRVSENVFNNNQFLSPSSETTLTVISYNQSLSATFLNNRITNNSCGAIKFVLDTTNSSEINLVNNVFENNGRSATSGIVGSAINLDLNNKISESCSLNLVGNTIRNNEGFAFSTISGSITNFDVTASENDISDNLGSGFLFFADCDNLKLNIKNNEISNNGDHGISILAEVVTENVTISNNVINNNSGSGISLYQTVGNLNFTAEDNNLSENNDSGMFFYSSDEISNATLKINSNVVKNNKNNNANSTGGVNIEMVTNLSATFNSNILSNNIGLADLFVAPKNSTSFCLEIKGNTAENGYQFSDSNGFIGNFNITPCNYSSVNIGDFHSSPITGVQSCPLGVPCP